jgi:hypothetical protein
MAEGKKVRLEYDVQTRDKYGRLLAYVYLEDGIFLNAELVKQGYAHVSTYPPNIKHAEEFVRLQQEAREKDRGLWRPQEEEWTIIQQTTSNQTASNQKTASNKTAFNEAAEDTVVYVTRTGSKYHRAGCRSLKKTCISMTLKDDALSYSPCRICNPPNLKVREVHSLIKQPRL